jgi:hypothetical protein
MQSFNAIDLEKGKRKIFNPHTQTSPIRLFSLGDGGLRSSRALALYEVHTYINYY